MFIFQVLTNEIFYEYSNNLFEYSKFWHLITQFNSSSIMFEYSSTSIQFCQTLGIERKKNSFSIFCYFMFVHDHLNLGFVMSLSIDVYVWRVYCYVIFVSVCVYTEVLCQGDRTTFDVHIWWHLLVSQAERLKRDQQNTIVNQTIS